MYSFSLFVLSPFTAFHWRNMRGQSDRQGHKGTKGAYFVEYYKKNHQRKKASTISKYNLDVN